MNRERLPHHLGLVFAAIPPLLMAVGAVVAWNRYGGLYMEAWGFALVLAAGFGIALYGAGWMLGLFYVATIETKERK